MSSQNVEKLSPIEEGLCPYCKADLNFSEEDRREDVEIECPKCSKKFSIEESEKLETKPEEKKKGLTGGAAALLIFVMMGIIGYAIFSSDWYQEGIPDVPEKAKPLYEVGQSLSGISMDEISSNWYEEHQKSSVKGERYLQSLKGSEIKWIAQIEDVSNYQVYYLNSFEVGKSQIMKLLVKKGNIGIKYYAYIDVTGNEEYINLDRGTIVKLSGNIAGFNQTEVVNLTLAPEITNARVEVVE